MKLKMIVFVALVGLAVAMPAAPTSAQQEKPAEAGKVRTLGVLLYPGFEALDAYGPIELWGMLGKRVRIVTVAAHRGEVQAAAGAAVGPKTVADFGFDDVPPLDLILVPGGSGAWRLAEDAATLQWVRERARRAEIVMSVCNGASILAASGILDGRPATTNKLFWERSTQPGPKVNWVRKARWVDDGDIVTSSGVSAGMDMSLAVIRRLYGEDIAARVAQTVEYDPHTDPDWDPFAQKAGLVE